MLCLLQHILSSVVTAVPGVLSSRSNSFLVLISFSLEWFLEWVAWEHVYDWLWLLWSFELNLLRLKWGCWGLIWLAILALLLHSHVLTKIKHLLTMESIGLGSVLLSKNFLWRLLAWVAPLWCFVSFWGWASGSGSSSCVVISTEHNIRFCDSLSRWSLLNRTILALQKPSHSAWRLISLDSNWSLLVLNRLLGEIFRCLPHDLFSLSVLPLRRYGLIDGLVLEKLHTLMALLIWPLRDIAPLLGLPSLNLLHVFPLLMVLTAKGLNISPLEFPLLKLPWAHLIRLRIFFWRNLLPLVMVRIIDIRGLVSFRSPRRCGRVDGSELVWRWLGWRDVWLVILWRLKLFDLGLRLRLFWGIVMLLLVLAVWVVLQPRGREWLVRSSYFLLSSLSDREIVWHLLIVFYKFL